MQKVLLDFETRSEVDLKAAGTYRYVVHRSTAILCLAFLLPGREVQVFSPDEPFPSELLDAVNDADFEFVAHNAMFDRLVWNQVLVRTLGVPSIDGHRWHDTAARAAYYGLPRGLAYTAKSLRLDEQKDDIGKRLINTLSKPGASGFRNEPYLLEKMREYCKQDLRTLQALDAVLPELPEIEREIYLLDQQINDRGILVDVELCQAASTLVAAAKARAVKRFYSITRLQPTQRTAIKKWLAEHGVDLPNTQEAVVTDKLLDPSINEITRDVLVTMVTSGKSSLSKYQTALNMTSSDKRIRGQLLYHGAHTGRWSGRGVQPQNFPRINPPAPMGDVCRMLKDDMTLDELDLLFGAPETLLSQCLRGMFIAPKGRALYCGDFKSIEALLIYEMAGEQETLKLLASGGDVYCDMASDIYNKKITPRMAFERALGKSAILGLNYGMGVPAFVMHLRKNGIRLTDAQVLSIFQGDRAERDKAESFELKMCYESQASEAYIKKIREFHHGKLIKVLPELAASRRIVNRFRKKYAKIVELWDDELADALTAVMEQADANNPWQLLNIGEHRWLTRTLPSGRKLHYLDPKAITQRGRPSLAYQSSSGQGGGRIRAHGAKLIENVISAIARDLMGHAMHQVAACGFDIVCTVHDEIIAEGNLGRSLQEFQDAMTMRPPWAKDTPVMVEAEIKDRYSK